MSQADFFAKLFTGQIRVKPPTSPLIPVTKKKVKKTKEKRRKEDKRKKEEVIVVPDDSSDKIEPPTPLTNDTHAEPPCVLNDFIHANNDSANLRTSPRHIAVEDPKPGSSRLAKIPRNEKNQKVTVPLPSKPAPTDTEVFTIDDSSGMSNESFSDKITIRVRWMGEVIKFSLKYNDTMLRLKKLLAEKIKQNFWDIKLYLQDDYDGVKDELHALDIKPGAILDCLLLVRAKEATTVLGNADEDTLQPNQIKVRLQGSGGSRQIATIKIDRGSPLIAALEQFALKFKLDAKTLTMKFDGDNVNPGDTPYDLDLDGDECIDVYQQIENNLQ